MKSIGSQLEELSFGSSRISTSTSTHSSPLSSSRSNSDSSDVPKFWYLPLVAFVAAVIIGLATDGFRGLIYGIFYGFFAIGIIQWLIELGD
ncbi:MAG: hypothetical protein U5L09_04690 [Bacteroidales bacterium]|nr:hypothetical protein [Bacteroidales bacterium]